MSMKFGVHVKLQRFFFLQNLPANHPPEKTPDQPGTLSHRPPPDVVKKGMKRHGRCMNVCVIGANHKATTKKLNTLLGCFLHGDLITS